MKACTLALILTQWLSLVFGFNLWNILGSDDSVEVPHLLRRDSNSTSAQSGSTGSRTSGSASKTTSSLSIDPNLPAGGVQLKTPVSTSSTYVKSGATVTFGWNYTSLIATPSAINIEAVCTQNSQTYTIAQNQSAKSTSVHWDTGDAGKDGSLHLITAEYTLVIYDASSSPDAIASAGQLSPLQYKFGIYLPQKYSPWPMNAKYVNAAISCTRPTILTAALAAVSLAFFFLM